MDLKINPIDKMKKVLFVLAVSALFTACTNDNLEEMHPACDTTGVVSFATVILPIMNASCGTDNTGCHINNSADGGYGFANYIDMMEYFVSPAKDLKFVRTLTHDPALTSSLYMPQGAAKLDECSIMKIQAWINNGKQNN